MDAEIKCENLKMTTNMSSLQAQIDGDQELAGVISLNLDQPYLDNTICLSIKNLRTQTVIRIITKNLEL